MTTTPSTVARARRLPRFAGALTVLALAAGALVATAEPAAASAVWVGSAPAGTKINPGDQVTSPNGQFKLIMQGDGNLVEYGIGNRVLWASNTAGSPGAIAVVGKNRALDITKNGKRLARWASAGTVNSTALKIRADGTMALLAGKSVVVNWTTYQDRVASGNTLLGGTVLRSDTTNTRILNMRTDGNLVQKVSGRVVWQSRTGGHPGAWAELQSKGNFVIWTRDASRKKVALWTSRTGTAGSGNLLVQVDGNVVLYGAKDTRVWSSRPVTGLAWPVNGTKITGKYGDDRGAGHVPRYHQGTDAPVPVGTPVYGSGTGEVTKTVANDASYGNYIVVTYGMTAVLTAHLSKIEVKKGQIVKLGTEIAKSGNTGQSTGPHVHVETRRNGTLVDPLKNMHFR
ncbi:MULTISPECIES: peptidoglycan DD-metalloendopeptidase family protein [unclassified Curtobacterium]|uniref:peptidoglycan DD-metalloendopeptidase family protein n=1 Tax=unclassified Curtobacterium TaxID=257496 RepID=UPI001046A7A9|nr:MULTISPECIES: peptidoglycan DD-metalloendopeptidase family protein [unclassified Curtobacterium]TCL71020.1 D-mannose binding lectin [Curtobacterium sp. PhB128]TCL89902.1 D-mannose binding lectin [Curtobacterium sp. PhB138]TCU50396.1 D-mannose binding lectin [Curtobacterium sp. PhB146]